MKFLSAGMDPELSGKKNSVKTATKWCYGSFLQLGPGRDAHAGFCTQIGGIPARNIPPCHVCAGLGMGQGGVTDLKKHLKNSWFGAVQVCEVTPEKPQPWGQQHTQGQV